MKRQQITIQNINDKKKQNEQEVLNTKENEIINKKN